MTAVARGARTNLALLGLLAGAFLTGWLAFGVARRPRLERVRDRGPAAVEVDRRPARDPPRAARALGFDRLRRPGHRLAGGRPPALHQRRGPQRPAPRRRRTPRRGH